MVNTATKGRNKTRRINIARQLLPKRKWDVDITTKIKIKGGIQ